MGDVIDASGQWASHEVGLKIRVWRLGRGLTEADLGRAADLTEQQVRDYEAGTRPVGARPLERIAAALNVPLSALLGPGLSDADLPGPQELIALLSAITALPAPIRAELLRLAQAMERWCEKG
jgi:transcriptional regulator with XRE-family HTH domain